MQKPEDFDYSDDELRRRYGPWWKDLLRRLWQAEHDKQERERLEQDKKDSQNGHHDK